MFFPNVPGATFIQGAMLIPESRVRLFCKRTPKKKEYQDSVDFMNGDWGFFLLKYKVNKKFLIGILFEC